MARLRKAVFFSIISVLVVILFTAITGLVADDKLGESEIEVTRTRVKILNNIINDLDKTYFEKMVYVAGKNAIYGLSDYYRKDYNSRIKSELMVALKKSVFYTGILNYSDGSSVNLDSCNPPFCTGSEEYQQYVDYHYTLDGLKSALSELFDDVGIDINTFNLELISVKQATPFEIEITAEIEYYFKDRNNIASWKGRTVKTAKINVIGVYAFDYESGISNQGPVTDVWRIDTGTYTEPSIYNKLSKRTTISPGLGICKSYCEAT